MREKRPNLERGVEAEYLAARNLPQFLTARNLPQVLRVLGQVPGRGTSELWGRGEEGRVACAKDGRYLVSGNW